MDGLHTVPFGSKQISRLIIGGNPFRGNSHFSKAMSADMEAFYTVEQIKKTLFEAQNRGINTVQARGDVLIQACIREFWAEGGTMHFIAQTASELRDLDGHVRQLAAFGCLGVYVHGTYTDRYYLDGQMDRVRDFLKTIRDTGVQTGLGTHMPQVIDVAEEEGWDLDFYMASMYNLSQPGRESTIVSGKMVEEYFDHSDRFPMLERVRATPKTCLVFKVFGASRLCGSPAQVRETLRMILGNIKPRDAVVVGMFPKYRDQVEENTRFVREILAEQLQGR